MHLIADRQHSGGDAVPLGEALGGQLVPDLDRLAAADQITGHEVAARRGADDLVEAHDRAAQGFQVVPDRRRLLPAAALEVVVDDIPVVGLEVAGREVLEGAADQLGITARSEQIRQLVRLEVELPERRFEVIGDDGVETVTPFLPLRPLHDGGDRLVVSGNPHVSPSQSVMA